MNFFFQNKQYLLLFGGTLIAILCILAIAVSLLFPTTPQNTPPTSSIPTTAPVSPGPSEFDPYSPEYKESVEQIHKEEQPLLDKDKKVSAFVNTLPVQGTYFTAKYDIATNSVTVTIPDDKKTEGDTEFTNYLMKYGVTDRSWIQNLTIRYRAIEPEVQ